MTTQTKTQIPSSVADAFLENPFARQLSRSEAEAVIQALLDAGLRDAVYTERDEQLRQELTSDQVGKVAGLVRLRL